MTTAIEIADQAIESAFVNMVKEYELNSGDVDPSQLSEIERVKSDLARILSEFAYNNLPFSKKGGR